MYLQLLLILIPAHFLQGRKITSLPNPMVEDDEISDPNYSTGTELKRRAKA